MHAFRNNRVLAHTGSRYPILQSPMGWIARAPLVSAVSAAGGFGLMETSTGTTEDLDREIDRARAETTAPFGLNLAIRFLRADKERERAALGIALDGRVCFVTTSAGDPRAYVTQIKQSGVTVYHSVASLDGALKAADAGVDGLVVEGNESGAVRGNEPIHLMVLLQAIRERVDLPLIAAGGIVDGRGMAAAFALGAEAVTMGTRFVASAESPVHDAYKRAIVDAPSVATSLLPAGGRAVWRVLRTPLARDVEQGGSVAELSARRIIDQLYVAGRLDLAMASAGESAALIAQVKTAKEIVEDTVAGFWREVERLAGLL